VTSKRGEQTNEFVAAGRLDAGCFAWEYEFSAVITGVNAAHVSGEGMALKPWLDPSSVFF
jgi:hypothetical protein